MAQKLLLAACFLVLISLAGCKGNQSASAGSSVPASAMAEGDVVVLLEDCPRAVQATIGAHVDDGMLMEIERTTDHGEVLYEVDVRIDGRVVEFDVAEDGTFRGYEDEDDEGDDDDDDSDEDDR